MNAVIKGAKKGSGQARKAVIAPDSAQSKTFINILYGLSEGEVEGLANGLQSVYLEETPLHDSNGSPNFQNIVADFRNGTNDQEYIEGFPDISSESAVGVELQSGTPWVRAISNTDLDALRIRLKWGALRTTNEDNGDVTGVTIDYAIDLQTGGGAWNTVIDARISDKTSTNYERSHRIDLPKSDNGWQVRVRRITPNSTSEYVSDKMYVEAITEVIDLKLSYPNTALLGLRYDAETFSNVAKVAVDLKGIKVKVPSNYNPITRAYTGLWDGTFKRAYTNNPAWIYYDICTSKRYALGDRLTSSMVDKWSLYRLAQYCDQMVNDGKGGQEPRFTCNVYLQSTEDAYAILNKLAGVFRAITFWDGNSIVCDADIPQDTFFTYTRANVIDGLFEYSGSRARDRHTVAKVAWDNPKNHYKTEYVYVRDEAAIAKLGVRVVDIDAWGCTSEGQAQRAGLWALKSEQLETRTVSFKVGLDGHIPLPGKVIEIADELFAGRANGGRISAVSMNRRTITVDRDNVVCRAGDRLVVNGEDGKAQARTVSSVSGRNITVSSAFDSVAAQNVWVVDAQDLKTMKFRVMSITQNEKHQFSINAVQYESSKYDAIDHGAFIDERPISIINPITQEPVSSVVLTSENMVQQGISVATMLISWDQAKGATKYQVEWRKDDGAWIKLPITGANSVEVQGIYSGNYEARVTAISAFDVASLPAYSVLTSLSGKTGLPPALANLTASGVLFGYKLKWNFPAIGALDTAYTEIEIATTANGANAAQLGLFAYPTTNHEIQGMQGNLTRYFRGRLIDRIGNIGPWSNWVGATTSADASAVLDILSGKITESQLHQNLQQKINQIDTIAGLDGDVGNLIDDISAVQTQVNQLNQSLNNETQARLDAIEDLEDGLTQEVENRQNAISQEIVDRNAAISAETNARNNAILQEANARSTAILNEKSERVAADSVLSQRIDTVSASFEGNAAAIQQEITARVDADLALSQRIDTVLVEVDENTAAINQEAIARADADAANASLIESVRLESNQNNLSTQALIIGESNARIDADKALAERVTGVEIITNPEMIGSTDDLIGGDSGYVGAWSILTAVQEGDLHQAQRTDLLTVAVNENSASILSEQLARMNADSALSERIDSLSVEFSDNSASINQKLQTLADKDQALASDISGMNVRVGQNEANIISESQARSTGDEANAQALTDYRSINDLALANVRQTAESAVTATSANTEAVQALDSRVTVAEGDASTAKSNAATALTKAETAVNEAGAAASLASQASAIASQAADTADSANQNAATALFTANTAANQSSANASQINALTVELGTKASAGALAETNANVAEIDGRVTANTTKIDGVYAQVNPDMIGSSEDYIGSTSGHVGAWSQLTAQIEGDEALGQRVDAVVAQINENTAAITAEATARANADSALTAQINTALSQVDNAKALIRTEQQTRADADIALGSRIDTLQAQVGDDLQQSIATIQQELDVLANADSALSGRVDTVQAATAAAQSSADQAILDAQNKSAAAEAAAKAYAEAQAEAERLAAIAAASDDATAKANAAESAAVAAAALDAKNKADAAKQAAIDAAALDATAKANAAEAAAKEVANAAQQAASAAAIAAGNKGEVIFGSTTPTAEKRLSQNLWIDTTGGLNTPKRWNGSTWVAVTDKAATDAAAAASAAQATATEALNKANTATQNIATVQTQVDTLTTQQSATASQVSTIQTTVDGNTASIQTVSESVNGLYVQKYIKLDVNGKVAGWGGANDGKESNFIVNSDSFAIGSGGSAGYYPFIFRNTPYTDPNTGTVFPVSAYFNSAFMDYQSVDTAHIKDLAVKSAQIDDAAVTTAKIDDLAVSTLKIQDNAVTVPVGVNYSADQTYPNAEVYTRSYDALEASPWGSWPTNFESSVSLWEAGFGTIGTITLNRKGGKALITATACLINPSSGNIGLAVANGGANLSAAERKYCRMVLSVYRDTTLVARTHIMPSGADGNSGIDFNGTLTLVAVDDSSITGNVTYTMTMGAGYIGPRNDVIVVPQQNFSIRVTGRSMSIVELKK